MLQLHYMLEYHSLKTRIRPQTTTNKQGKHSLWSIQHRRLTVALPLPIKSETFNNILTSGQFFIKVRMYRVPEELKRHSIQDGEGGHYSTNLDRNRYGSDDQYLATVVRYNLDYLDICPCLVGITILDAKGGNETTTVSVDPCACICNAGPSRMAGPVSRYPLRLHLTADQITTTMHHVEREDSSRYIWNKNGPIVTNLNLTNQGPLQGFDFWHSPVCSLGCLHEDWLISHTINFDVEHYLLSHDHNNSQIIDASKFAFLPECHTSIQNRHHPNKPDKQTTR